MPIYEYECRKCGLFEQSQSINDDPLKRCPKCRSAVQKLLSASAFHLKGGGWYSDGYDKKKSGSSDSNSSDSSTASPSKSDAKPSSAGSKKSKSDGSGKSGKSGKKTSA